MGNINYMENFSPGYWVKMHAFLYKQCFLFNLASVLLNFFLNWASNVAQVLLNIYKYHHNETLYIFTIIVFISRPRSIYVYLCDLLSISIFIFIMINCIISWIQKHLFFCLFFEYVLSFLGDNVDEECE